MTTKDLFRCIGNLSDTMIEEANDIRRKKRWLPIAALAACAVLAVSIPLAVRGIGSCKSASTATSAAETPTMEAPAEDMRDQQAADEATGGSDGSHYDSDPTAARILSTELGGLRLGMTESKILAIAGTPDGKSNSGVVQRDDGIQEIC